MQKKWRVLLGSLAIVALPVIAYASFTGTDLLTESFTDASKVDLNATTAMVDTGNGWVTLGHAPQANVIASQSQNGSFPSDIVVADQSGVNWYSYDQTTGQMLKNTAMSPTAYTNPLGVALVPSSKSFYVFDGTVVHQAVFNGSGAVDNPIMAVSGLSNLVSVTGVSDTTFAAIDKSGNVSAYTYDQGSNHPIKDSAHSFSTGLSGVVAVKNIPGTYNYVVFTKTKAYQYVFDQTSGSYMQNSAYTDTSNGTTVAGDSNSTGDLITMLSPSQSTAYSFDQSTSTMAQSNMLSVGSLSSAIAVSMPSDTSDVIASSDGKVQMYQYDQSSNRMVANSNLLLPGFSFVTLYDAADVYQSVPVASGQQYNLFKLTTDEQNDTGTSISYALSTDGGNTFAPITPNTWTHLPMGTTSPPVGSNVANGAYVVRATLNSTSTSATPRLLDVDLQADLDTTPPTAPGAPYGNPSPSYQTSTDISWTAATDDTGIQTYLFRYSTDGGITWSNWLDTESNTPGYVLTVPQNTAALYTMQVKARDFAGNDGPISPIGTIYIDTNPLGIVKTPSGSNLTVTDIKYPALGQAAPPTDILPVLVEAGGEVTYQIQTTGDAQSVAVTYSDGLTQTLYPTHLASDPNDLNTWVGYYYPSSTQTIPSTAPQGEIISLTSIQVTRPGNEYDTTSQLLQIEGAITGTNKYLMTKLTQ